MSYDDYLKQNPEFAMRQARISAGNYHCPNCGHDFDKPASQSYGWGAFFLRLNTVNNWSRYRYDRHWDDNCDTDFDTQLMRIYCIRGIVRNNSSISTENMPVL